MKLMDINLNVLIEGHGTQTVKFLQQVSLDIVSYSKYAETGMTTFELSGTSMVGGFYFLQGNFLS